MFYMLQCFYKVSKSIHFLFRIFYDDAFKQYSKSLSVWFSSCLVLILILSPFRLSFAKLLCDLIRKMYTDIIVFVALLVVTFTYQNISAAPDNNFSGLFIYYRQTSKSLQGSSLLLNRSFMQDVSAMKNVKEVE